MSKKIYSTSQEKWKAARLRNRDAKLEKRRDLRNTFDGRFKDLLDKCKQRSKNKNWACDLTLEFLITLWNNQLGKCAITQIDMHTTSGNRATEGVNPFVVSVDRIDSLNGYTQDNVWLVCSAVNTMKNDFTIDQFRFWIRTISREAFNDEGTFNDYPEREYTQASGSA